MNLTVSTRKNRQTSSEADGYIKFTVTGSP